MLLIVWEDFMAKLGHLSIHNSILISDLWKSLTMETLTSKSTKKNKSKNLKMLEAKDSKVNLSITTNNHLKWW